MRTMRRTTTRKVTAVLAVGVLLAASACGSSDDSEKKDKGALPKGDPVKIGLFDPSAGAYKSPGVGVGARAALDHINYDLGGIHERPVEFVTCATDGTPETTISCANKFAEEKVVAALDGYNTAGDAIDILATAKIPLIGGIPFNGTAGAAKGADNRVFFSAPQAAFLIGAMQAFATEGKKSVTLVAADIPATQASFAAAKAVGGAMGLKVEGLTYSLTNPNFDAIASTIKQTNPDVGGLMAAPDPSVCTKLVQALRPLGYKGTIFTAACTEFIKTNPEEATGAALYSSHWLPQAKEFAPKDKQDELAIAEKGIKEVGGTADFYAFAQFGVTTTLAEALNASPDATLDGPGILETLKNLKDFDSFLGPKITCGQKEMPNCTTQMLLFNVNDKAQTEPSGGDWVTPAPAAIAAALQAG